MTKLDKLMLVLKALASTLAISAAALAALIFLPYPYGNFVVVGMAWVLLCIIISS